MVCSTVQADDDTYLILEIWEESQVRYRLCAYYPSLHAATLGSEPKFGYMLQRIKALRMSWGLMLRFIIRFKATLL